MWQAFIPAQENPMVVNPARGFVSSANQKDVPDSYPYYLGRASNFPPYRGYIINRKLTAVLCTYVGTVLVHFGVAAEAQTN